MLILFFALDEYEAGRVERVLREPTESQGQRIGHSWMIDSVPNVRLDQVAAARAKLRSLGSGFLSDHLPGAFSTDLQCGHPACEVVTARRWDPMAPEREEERGSLSYLWATGLDSPMRGWVSAGLEGWRLDLPDALARSPAVTLSAKTENVTGPASSADPGTPTEQVSSLLFHRMEGLLALWASAELLRGYGALLGSVRDEVLAETRGTRASVRRLRDVRRRLLRDAADARTLAEDLTSTADEASDRVWWFQLDFEPTQPDYWREAHLHELLLGEIRRRARAVATSERRVRDDLAVESEVVGAMANLRAQRSVALLTTVIGGVSTALLAYQIWG
jgi:hypothetical protein